MTFKIGVGKLVGKCPATIIIGINRLKEVGMSRTKPPLFQGKKDGSG